MSEFTKGEWKTRNPLAMEGMYHVFIYGADGKKFCRVDGYADGTCCGEKGYPDKADVIAISNLIAAAPDMYEALKAVDRAMNDEQMFQASFVVDKALVKAKGESE